MLRYMLDTNVCIDLLRGKASAVFDRLSQCEAEEVGLSAITLAELYHGVEKSARRSHHAEILSNFCAPLAILPFDSRTAEPYGLVRAELERAGTPIGPLDTLIAAHAISVQAVLVTRNEREFRRVKRLEVENWLG